MKIGLVTDSTSDLPEDLVISLGIRVIPAIININGQSYEDGKGLSRQAYYDLLPSLKKPPTTSSPSVGIFENTFQDLISSGAEHIISIHPPANLSGLYNVARLAAKSFKEKIYVIDSGQLSMGLGYQVLAAAEAITNRLGIDEVLNQVLKIKDKVRVHALLDSLTYLRRSGRVSWAKAMVGGFLNLKPLIDLRFGTVKRIGQARTRNQGILRLKEDLMKLAPLERLSVLHTNAESDAKAFLESLNMNFSVPPLIVNVTTVIGTHVGPNGLGWALVPSS
ncbi:MAG: DegV family protein [Anaerolineales bacterium]